MLILYEGEILHTDSSTDILEHYGVKGMRWGKRLHKYKDALNIYEKNGYVKDKRKNISNNVSRNIGLEPMVKKVR